MKDMVGSVANALDLVPHDRNRGRDHHSEYLDYTPLQSIEGALKSSILLEFAHDYVRRFVGFAEEDRIFADDINKIKSIISDFSFVQRLNEYASGKEILLNTGYDEFGAL